VFACQKTRRALVVAADLALGQFVQDEAALFVERFGSDDLAAQVAEVGEPVTEVERQLLVEVLAKLLGQRVLVAGGGEFDLQVSAADDGGKVEVAEWRVVDGVAEDPGCGGLREDCAVDCGIVRRGDDEEGPGEVTLAVGAAVEREFTCGGLLDDGVAGLGRDNSYGGVCGTERCDLRLSEMAGADDDSASAGELEEDRKQRHARAPTSMIAR